MVDHADSCRAAKETSIHIAALWWPVSFPRRDIGRDSADIESRLHVDIIGPTEYWHGRRGSGGTAQRHDAVPSDGSIQLEGTPNSLPEQLLDLLWFPRGSSTAYVRGSFLKCGRCSRSPGEPR